MIALYAKTRQLARRWNLLHWLIRSVYFFLAAVHVMPIVAVTGRVIERGFPLAEAISLLVLVLVTAAFALKAADAACLRFRRPGLGFLVVMLIAGLAHHDVVPREGIQPLLADSGSVVLVASAALASRRVRQRILRLLESLATGLQLHMCGLWLWAGPASFHDRLYGHRFALAAVRGPPALD
ncbi:MAG: hypothetical protein JJU36_03260 [Phycisphaeraceae bacterium]|nr:hypothetical protein [Phycisphaeraceae bacterium]